jgi:hypothetical protein
MRQTSCKDRTGFDRSAAPRSSWTSIGTGIFGPTGNFSFNATMDPAKPQQFFIVQAP